MTLHVYVTPFDRVQHFAFVLGDIGDGANVPARMHRADILGDVFSGGTTISSFSISLWSWTGPGTCDAESGLLRQFTVIRRGIASFAFGRVSVKTPSSNRALMVSRSILPERVNPRA